VITIERIIKSETKKYKPLESDEKSNRIISVFIEMAICFKIDPKTNEVISP
jgi:hypothetical protein